MQKGAILWKVLHLLMPFNRKKQLHIIFVGFFKICDFKTLDLRITMFVDRYPPWNTCHNNSLLGTLERK